MMTPDLQMENKIVLITGATDGIGKETALAMARMGAQTIITGRNAEKTLLTARQIAADTGNQHVEILVGDLSSQAEIRRMAAEFLDRHSHLDVLINNAGAIFMQRQVSVDGIEMTFALNHLSYFLLTHLLLDAIKASGRSRIVNVSSEAHRGASLNFENLQNERGYTGFKAYSQSKLANIYFTRGLAAELEGTEITANCLHPGFVATRFGRSNGGLFDPLFKLFQFAALTPEEGAQTSIYLASSPEAAGITGKYFSKSREARASEISYDMNIAKQLWDVSLEMTGLAVPVKESTRTRYSV